MSITAFEDLTCWQKAKVLTVNIYKICEKKKDYSLNNQMQRASVSIMNNIAEGFERGGNKEFKYFLFVAKGSCGEVRSMVRLSQEIGYISEVEGKELISQTTEVSKIISGLIKTL